MGHKTIGVGLLGLGTVGGAVAEALLARADAYAERAGAKLVLRGALVRDLARTRSPTLSGLPLTTNADELLNDPSVNVVVELIGGEEPAHTLLRRALTSGRHVVTANKEVMAKHGDELRALAERHEVALRYEASVGGGIPIIASLQRDLVANEITAITAIINGTTNYILTRMAHDKLDFAEALAQAQALGYAEADPRDDVEGIDAAYKLTILAGLAFHTAVRLDDVYHEGISRLAARDFRYADELGYAVKLLALAERTEGRVQTRVHPAFIAHDQPLAKVDGVFNAVQIEGDLLGRVMLQGRGAGAEPTASAVIADLLTVARDATREPAALEEAPASRGDATRSPLPAASMDALKTRYYVRMRVTDRPGVLARVAQMFGDEGISIASVIQKEADEEAGTAEIVIMTHSAVEGRLQEALRRVEALDVVAEIGNFVRVVG